MRKRLKRIHVERGRRRAELSVSEPGCGGLYRKDVSEQD